MNDEFEPSDYYEDSQRAQWEEEAHYWHTVTAFVDLIEQHGYDKLMSDVGYTIDRREADVIARKRSLEAVLPMPDLSFLTIRKV